MRSNHLSYNPLSTAGSFPFFGSASACGGGDDGIRTHDPLLAGQVLSQLSYTPIFLLRKWYRFTVIYCSAMFRFFPVFSFFERSLKIEQWIQRLPSLIRLTSNIVFLLVSILHRKEVIQPHLPIRLPCYDLTPIIEPTFDHCLLAVSTWASGVPNFHGLTGGVYKARERIHRGMLIRDY